MFGSVHTSLQERHSDSYFWAASSAEFYVLQFTEHQG